MKKSAFFILVLFSVFVTGQDIVDIEADFIELGKGQLNFFTKKSDNTYQINSYGRDIFDNLDFIETGIISSSKIDSLLSIKEVISVGELKSINLEEFQNEVANKSIFFNKYDEFHILKNFNNSTFGIGEIKNDFESIDDLRVYNYYRVVPVRINKAKLIYQLVSLSSNYDNIIDYLLLSNKGYNYSGDFEDLDFEKNQSVELLDKWYKQWCSHTDVGDLYSLSGNYIQDVQKEHDLSSIRYDSFGDNYSKYIVGYRDSEITVYNLFLEDITPDNLRSVSPCNEKCIQVLVGNDIKYLSNSGKITMHPLVSDVSYCGLGISDDTKIGKNNESYFLKYETEIVCAIEDDILDYDFKTIKVESKIDMSLISEDVTFINKEISQITYFDLQNKNPTNFLISKNDNGRFVATPFFVEYDIKGDVYETNHKLVIRYDQQMICDSIDYNKNDNLMLVIRDNLKGYLGINKMPKYKVLEEYVGSFAQFELPDGQRGWLKRDGTEYINQ